MLTFQPIDMDAIGWQVSSREGMPDFHGMTSDFAGASLDLIGSAARASRRAGEIGLMSGRVGEMELAEAMYSPRAERGAMITPSPESDAMVGRIIDDYNGRPFGAGFDATMPHAPQVGSDIWVGGQARIITRSDGRVAMRAGEFRSTMDEALAPEARARFNAEQRESIFSGIDARANAMTAFRGVLERYPEDMARGIAEFMRGVVRGEEEALNTYRNLPPEIRAALEPLRTPNDPFRAAAGGPDSAFMEYVDGFGGRRLGEIAGQALDRIQTEVAVRRAHELDASLAPGEGIPAGPLTTPGGPAVVEQLPVGRFDLQRQRFFETPFSEQEVIGGLVSDWRNARQEFARLREQPPEVQARVREAVLQRLPPEQRQGFGDVYDLFMRLQTLSLDYRPVLEVEQRFLPEPRGEAEFAQEQALRMEVVGRGADEGLMAQGCERAKAGFEGIINIMLEGRIRSGEFGPMAARTPSGGLDTNPQLYSGGHGPFYVIVESGTLNPAFGGPVGEARHLAYVVPSEAHRAQVAGALSSAVERGLMSWNEAVEALSKVVTYREFVDAPPHSFEPGSGFSSSRWEMADDMLSRDTPAERTRAR